MNLFYREYGDGDPLIILHGLLGSSGNWHTLSGNVFSRHFRVLAVDLRNHGRSPHSQRFDYEAMASDVLELMDTENISPAVLLGHSMGGKVAMRLALDRPDRLRRLVVVDIAPRAYPPSHAQLLEALQATDPAAVDSRNAVDEALARRIPSGPVRQFLMKNLSYDRESGRYSWQMNLEAISTNYETLNAALRADGRFEGPVLFVRGEHSDYVSDTDLDDIRSIFPKAEFATIAGAGHWVHADRPEEFSDVVLTFLRQDGD